MAEQQRGGWPAFAGGNPQRLANRRQDRQRKFRGARHCGGPMAAAGEAIAATIYLKDTEASLDERNAAIAAIGRAMVKAVSP